MAKRGNEVAVSKGTLERMPRPLSAFDELDRLFEDFFGRRWLRPAAWPRAFGEPALGPRVEVLDRDNEVVVRAEVPGYSKGNVEVSVSGTTLTLRGEAVEEKKEEKEDYYYSEISHGAFSRSIALPVEVDDAKAKATMQDGVLELTLPKVEQSKRRTIAIS